MLDENKFKTKVPQNIWSVVELPPPPPLYTISERLPYGKPSKPFLYKLKVLKAFEFWSSYPIFLENVQAKADFFSPDGFPKSGNLTKTIQHKRIWLLTFSGYFYFFLVFSLFFLKYRASPLVM